MVVPVAAVVATLRLLRRVERRALVLAVMARWGTTVFTTRVERRAVPVRPVRSGQVVAPVEAVNLTVSLDRLLLATVRAAEGRAALMAALVVWAPRVAMRAPDS
ncbi:hypothetical protein BN2476_350298 [Paraburkholderia piptadeniae]|uniref:Uncharacterized protein n=1 Tax=Paraburkholderia piptadeniae TaxID=1701573 RepID=A0A1N7S8Z8_9BURK|nr:hypothetical protein BN2476_350298 [Paraburkholderia piptadeniae]